MSKLTIIKGLIIVGDLLPGRYLIDKGHPSADLHQVVRQLANDEDEYAAWESQRSDTARVIEIDGAGLVLV